MTQILSSFILPFLLFVEIVNGFNSVDSNEGSLLSGKELKVAIGQVMANLWMFN